MQNRYAGDIGDFGKLGLLRTLYAAGFSVGVNWYLNPNLTSKELNNKEIMREKEGEGRGGRKDPEREWGKVEEQWGEGQSEENGGSVMAID